MAFERIDIKSVVANKNPKLAKRLPGFVYSYLNKITHIREINDFLENHHTKEGLDFMDAIIEDFDVNVQVIGKENIKNNHRAIFVANHPLGGLDGVAFVKAISEFHRDLVFPVNDILLTLPNTREFFVPINKHGSNVNNFKLIDEAFAGDKTVLFFPAGLCSRKKRGIICDLEWKKTFVNKAKKHHRDIVPVFISGKNSNFFYNLSNCRNFLNIKANVEMLYLINEVYKQKNTNIVLNFGKPIPYTTLNKSKTDKEWAQHIKDQVYHLGKQIDN